MRARPLTRPATKGPELCGATYNESRSVTVTVWTARSSRLRKEAADEDKDPERPLKRKVLLPTRQHWLCTQTRREPRSHSWTRIWNSSRHICCILAFAVLRALALGFWGQGDVSQAGCSKQWFEGWQIRVASTTDFHPV